MNRKLKLLIAGMFLATTSSALATVHYVNLNNANPTPPYTNWATAATNIQDAVDAAVTGDGIVVTNGTYATGSRVENELVPPYRVVVDKPLVLSSVNGPDVTVIDGGRAVRCLYLTTNTLMVGFTLTNGFGGVECESTSTVLSNCVLTGNSYGAADGCTLNNCILTGNSAAEAGGADYCILNNCTLAGNWGSYGGGAASSTLNHCTLIGNSANEGGGAASSTLNNCTLTGNSALGAGGGTYGCTLNNCILTGNSAEWEGGGAHSGRLNNCTLTGNSAVYGGGTEACTVNNCTLVANGASYGGGADNSNLNSCLVVSNGVNATGAGAFDSTLNNCTVWGNTAPDGTGGIEGCVAHNCIIFGNDPSNYSLSGLDYCCTTPDPGGTGNITNDPALVNAAAGNYHLSPDSPCINAGNNAYATNSTDLDGNPRILGGTVDMGAYEYQTPASIISYAWLQQFGLPTDGTADYADSDGDGMNNWQEWMADTSPLDAKDYLHITSFTRSGTYNTLWWTGKSTRLYLVERRASLDAATPWETIITNAVPGWNNVGFDNMGPQYFYRIRAVRP